MMRYGIRTALIAALVLAGMGIAQTANAQFRDHYRRDTEVRIISDWYEQYLRREPDTRGLRDWLRALDLGYSFRDVQAGIVGSAEYYELHGADPQSFVVGMYRDVLGRRPDRWEVDSWLRRLDYHGSIEALAYEFLNAADLELRPDVRIYAPDRRLPVHKGIRLNVRIR